MCEEKKPAPAELDPVVVLLQLGSIHPMHLSQLVEQCLAILTSVTGLTHTHAPFIPLRAVQVWEDLALFDWQEMERDMTEQGMLSRDGCQCVVKSMQLMCDRALLHVRMHRAFSSTTLRLCQGSLRTSNHSCIELGQAYQEVEQAITQADKALHTGRALSSQFQREVERLAGQFRGGVLRPAWWEGLQGMLVRMYARYAEYEQLFAIAVEKQGFINWYLAWEPHTEASDRQIAGKQDVHAA